MSSVDIAEDIVCLIREDYNGCIPKYVLEGHILYTFGKKHFQLYRVVMQLELDGVIESVSLDDGEYYQLLV